MDENPGQGMFSPRESKRTNLTESRKKKRDTGSADRRKEHANQESSKSIRPTLQSSQNDQISDIGRNLIRQQSQESTHQKKKRTLHIYDFKKFKFMRKEEILKRYSFG